MRAITAKKSFDADVDVCRDKACLVSAMTAIFNFPVIPLLIMIIVLAAVSGSAQLRETRQLTSNNIIGLAGSGDTLWIATERGFNYQTSIDPKGSWPGFEANDLGSRLWGMAFGGGAVAALVGNSDPNSNNYIGFWRFDHATGKQNEEYFRFSRAAGDDYIAPSGSMVYAYGSYWAAFNRGGLVRYDPKSKSVSAVMPGGGAKAPQDIEPLDAKDSAKFVTETGVLDGGLILAVTKSAVWAYNPAGGLSADEAWKTLEEKPVDHIYKAIDTTNFRPMLAAAGDNPNPEINTMLFLPRADNAGAGTLAVGTRTGLYICESAEPLAGVYPKFSLVKYVRPVKPEEAYALPGVIRGSYDGRYDRCVFVYKLKKDGDVTISVYDYNMSLVKTVVKGARRGGSKERSTDPQKDFWDGTNAGGKRVWPGVYYFKITSTGGDRLFGKVILAN